MDDDDADFDNDSLVRWQRYKTRQQRSLKLRKTLSRTRTVASAGSEQDARNKADSSSLKNEAEDESKYGSREIKSPVTITGMFEG